MILSIPESNTFADNIKSKENGDTRFVYTFNKPVTIFDLAWFSWTNKPFDLLK